MVGFIWFVAIVAIAAQLLYDRHKAKKQQRRLRQAVSDFVDEAIADSTLYPVVNGSDGRLARLLSIDKYEASKLLCTELTRRGLSSVQRN